MLHRMLCRFAVRSGRLAAERAHSAAVLGGGQSRSSDLRASGGGEAVVRSWAPRAWWSGSVPRDRVALTAARSSGAGGQHVNKVSTKVALRFTLSEAEWLDDYTKERLAVLQRGRINKSGEFVLECQETRSQARNREIAFDALTRMCKEAAERPKPTAPEKKERVSRLKHAEEEARRDFKGRQSEKKKQRRKNNFRDEW